MARILTDGSTGPSKTGYTSTGTTAPPPPPPAGWTKYTLVRGMNSRTGREEWVWQVAHQETGHEPTKGGVRIKAWNPFTGKYETNTVYGGDPRKAAAAASSGAAGASAGSSGSGPSYTAYSIDRGKWQKTQASGRAPSSGGYWAWAINPKTGRMERHKVYSHGDANAGRPMSAAQVKQRYWQTGERYFNAQTNRWDRRYQSTEAEQDAKAAGLHKDGHGYYRMVDGHRQYVTGWDRDSGRRYHYERQGGRRSRVWDDPRIAPLSIEAYRETRDQLKATRKSYEGKMRSLREQYRNARSDQHVLKRTILDRIRQMESTVDSINHAMRSLPKPEFHSIHAAKRPKFDGGVMVAIDFSTDGYTFVNPLKDIDSQTRVFVRATISVGERKWRPDLLAVPDMVRVKWDAPTGWDALDKKAVKAGGTDEYLCSTPLYLVREYESPDNGWTHGEFVCRVALYQFTDLAVSHPHDEGT